MRLVLAAGLALLGSGCTTDSGAEAGSGGPAATREEASSAEPTPAATARSGYVLSQVRRGCGPSDFVGVLGRLTGPPGLPDFDGLTVEVKARGAVVGSSSLKGSDFIVYPKGGLELPAAADVRVVGQSGAVLAEQTAVDLRFAATTPSPICG